VEPGRRRAVRRGRRHGPPGAAGAARGPGPRGGVVRPSLTILLTPRGAPFNQALAEELAVRERLIVLCGRYEGFDERIVDILAPREVSLGDFILGGGEVAAMAVIEAVARLLPGVVGDPASVVDDSFSRGLLDHPCYTGRRSWKDIRCRRCYAPGTTRRFANGASSGRSKQR